MEIQFYLNNSEYNKINKSLTSGETLTGTLRDQSNVVNPTIVVEGGSAITTYNYCYIPEFHRYYFINEIVSIRNNIWSVSLKSDVLMSFKDQILKCSGIVEDSTTEGTAYLNGSQFVSNCKNYTDIVNFANGFNSEGEYILITAGG